VPLLECRDISVRFGGNRALDGVSVTAEEGTITGLIGPNGAGKTTLFNVVCGLLPPTSGSVLFAGRDITREPPFQRARLGIGRTFQRLELFTSLSVRENIRVAGDIRNRWHRGRIDAAKEADRIVELLGLEQLADKKVSDIPTGMARRVELGRALMTHPKLLLLDEPASGQDEAETKEFGDLLLRLCAEGVAIFLVEHDVGLVMRTCSFIQVLDFGKLIATGSPEEIRTDQAVLDAYLGEGSHA
jgi:branched-chain amino acid transport system ATP-binding protein